MAPKRLPLTLTGLFAILIAGDVLWSYQRASSHRASLAELSAKPTPVFFTVAGPTTTGPTPASIKKDPVLRLEASDENRENEHANSVAKKIQILDDVFASKNDNDPRLDQEFNHLSAEAKQALEGKYDQLKTEARNERGTIVFLIGRNLDSPEDFDFLKKVLSEPPCLSLSDCSSNQLDTPPGSGHSEATETTPGLGVTLDYPQYVALKSLETYLSHKPDSHHHAEALNVIREGMKSKSERVSQLAASLWAGLKQVN